jgi:cell division protein FtsN
MPSPFLARAPAPAKEEAAKGAAPAPRGEEPAAKGESRTRFDFYKILPGAEESASETRKEARAGPAAPAREVFYLQAGAFQSAPDADSLKARLALLGIEATIQTTTLADRGVWHRVRIGPYTSVEELNRTRETLQRNGVETSLIRVREGGVE